MRDQENFNEVTVVNFINTFSEAEFAAIADVAYGRCFDGRPDADGWTGVKGEEWDEGRLERVLRTSWTFGGFDFAESSLPKKGSFGAQVGLKSLLREFPRPEFCLPQSVGGEL